MNQHRNPKVKDFPEKFLVYEDPNENEIFHEKVFIGTKLGGEKQRLRYYGDVSK